MYGNSGELGDFWGYMYHAIHESSHVINPSEILSRSWLREGWGSYNGYNILVANGDINQETADYYIYNAKLWTGAGNNFLWEDYVINDYEDGFGNFIQESAGYEITAWMFSMLRDNHSLDWNKFYQLFEKNGDTLEEAWNRFGTSVYFIDTVILELFTRSSDADFSTFQYDGGPGWGVRNILNIDWYGDLTPTVLEFEDLTYNSGDDVTLNATIENIGDTDQHGRACHSGGQREDQLGSGGRNVERDS